MENQPYIAPQRCLREITPQVVVLSIILTLVLAVANAYLALKIGILTSASIPAAMISMGLLRFCRNSNVLQNNLVQTAASAGEAVAGGIVYTVPALVMIHYWHHFPYWINAGIAFVGGLLGVMFSIPIRRILVSQPSLPFPEGRAIAEVLKVGDNQNLGLQPLVWGGVLGALMELFQTGFKLLASNIQIWFVAGRSLVGFGAGFSATMMGAGYLMGLPLGISIFSGAVIGWLLSVPILSYVHHIIYPGIEPAKAVMHLWGQSIRYMGVGAMFVAGLWTLGTLLKPIVVSLKQTVKARIDVTNGILQRTEKDIPFYWVVLGTFLLMVLCYGLFAYSFPWEGLGLTQLSHSVFLMMAVAYVLLLGFLIAAICSYFSGLVGVTATPGSAVIIAGLLLVALLIRFLLNMQGGVTAVQWLAAAAVTILVGSIIEGAAAIANDNTQDLKVGHLLGATPWKQQLMLMLGVVVSSLVIPPVMEVLFQVYGLADVLPRTGMDPTQTLPAPPAALMAAVTQGVFNHSMPWDMVAVGAGIAVIIIMVGEWLKKYRGWSVSVLGVAIGIYLPLQSSMPLFFGGVLAFMVQQGIKKRHLSHGATCEQRGMLLACGLLAGSALMDVCLAIPFAMARSPDILRLAPMTWLPVTQVFGILSVVFLAVWFYRCVLLVAND